MNPPKAGAAMSHDRRQLTAELQSRSVQLFVTLASIGDAVITTDSTNSITFLNPMAEKLTGWSLEEAVGLDIEDVFYVFDEATGNPIQSTVQQAITTLSRVVLPAGAILVRKDGGRIPIDDSAAPIQDMEGNVLGAVLVFRDITDRKKAENLVKYRSELDRMAARISTAFITSPVSEVDSGIDSALREIGEFLGADRSYVVLFSEDVKSLVDAYEWHAEDIHYPPWKVAPAPILPYWIEQIRIRRHIYVSGVDEIPAEAVAERELWTEAGIKTLVAVPMSQEDKVLGIVGVDAIRESRPWPEDLIDFLFVIGNVFASALGRRDSMRRLEEAREREVEIGSRIQQTLLIGEPPAVFADFQLAAITIPSSRIDGDFYDFLLHPNRSLDVIFGDVMGKGVPAALLAAGSKTEFLRNLSNLMAGSRRGVIPQPQEIVNSVHGTLTPQLLSLDSFVTLSYARFDPWRRKLTLVDCGNMRLLRCSGNDGSIEFLSGFNVPLGFSASEIYTQAEFTFDPGDTFVFYSDGVTEARNPSGEMFGTGNLCELIASRRHLPPHLIVEAMRETIVDFVGSSAFTDDFTCVVVKVAPEVEAVQPTEAREIQLSSNMGELTTIRSFLHRFCEHRQSCWMNEKEMHLMELAMTEVVSNIIKHSYHNIDGRPIWARIELVNNILRVRFSHWGDPFTGPTRVPVPPLDGAREGGFGLFIITNSVDQIDYGVDSEGRQYIELTKTLRRIGEDYAV